MNRYVHGTVGLYMIISFFILIFEIIITDNQSTFWTMSFIISFVVFLVMGFMMDSNKYSRRVKYNIKMEK